MASGHKFQMRQTVFHDAGGRVTRRVQTVSVELATDEQLALALNTMCGFATNSFAALPAAPSSVLALPSTVPEDTVTPLKRRVEVPPPAPRKTARQARPQPSLTATRRLDFSTPASAPRPRVGGKRPRFTDSQDTQPIDVPDDEEEDVDDIVSDQEDYDDATTLAEVAAAIAEARAARAT